MNPVAILILQILKLSLEAYVETLKGIPVESRQEAWRRHEAHMQKLEGFFQRLLPDEWRTLLDGALVPKATEDATAPE